jgi:hypothetical protein
MHLGKILIRIALDPLFPPVPEFSLCKKTTYDILPENKFELVFEESVDSKQINAQADTVMSIVLMKLR